MESCGAGDGRCNGQWHWNADRSGVSYCPEWAANEVRERIQRERDRFVGAISAMERRGGSGWEGFDASEASTALAFDAMRRFAAGRPPVRSVYLRSGTGRGKTRLFLAAYFDLLAAGVDARYTSPSKLRAIFRAMRDGGEAENVAESDIASLKKATVIFFDDIGLAGDERFIGEFREQLQEILDATAAVFAIATNLTGPELERNPDVGPANFSRLVCDAEIVVIADHDRRLAGATVLS